MTMLGWLMMMRLAGSAIGWGAGHNDHVLAVLDRLPEPWRASITADLRRQAAHEFSHYADSFEPFDAELVGADKMAKLAELGVKRRYDLHHDHGRAVAYLMLVDSLRDQRYDRATFWVCNLAHVTGDIAALNHDALCHIAIYDFAPYGLELPNGTKYNQVAAPLDLSWLTHEDNQQFGELVDVMVLPDDGRDGPTVLLDVLSAGCEASDYLAQRGALVLAASAELAQTHHPEAKARAQRLVGELGAWSAVRVIRDASAAVRLSQGPPLQLGEAVMKSYQTRREESMRARALEHDALYAPLLRPLEEGQDPAIGVVLEPSWQMNEAMLGFASRRLAAAVCRTLLEAGRGYATLDLREVVTNGLPEPAQLPLLVVAATSFNNYLGLKVSDLDQHLTTYLQAGGKVLWLGGSRPPASVAKLVGAELQQLEKQHYPLPMTPGRTVLQLGRTSFPLARQPETPAGWQRPSCPYTVSGGATLVSLSAGAQSVPVGAAWPATEAKLVYLPVYAVHPFLWTNAKILAEPAQPRLDAVGARAFWSAVEALGVQP